MKKIQRIALEVDFICLFSPEYLVSRDGTHDQMESYAYIDLISVACDPKDPFLREAAHFTMKC